MGMTRTEATGDSVTRDSWTTPPAIRDRLDVLTEGKGIYLDPCSNPNSVMGAMVEWFGPHAGGTDGLIQPWVHAELGLTYVNPPYSEKYIWARKAYEESVYREAEVVCLLPADMAEAWFHDYGTKADAHCFPRGRLQFGGDRPFPSPFPVVILYYGRRPGKFRDAFDTLGWCPPRKS
jgi:hypothetical protein